MEVTLLDTKTGNTKVVSDVDASYWYWSEGNGSCDCTRAIHLGVEDEMDQEMCANNPDLKPDHGICFGAKRILVVDVDGDLEGATKTEALEAFNGDYPSQLKEQKNGE